MTPCFRQHGRLTIGVMALFLGACSGGADHGASDTAHSPAAAPGAAAGPQPGRYALADFSQLRWLEGSWRGTLPDGGHFYERYRFVDDSTIVMQGFPDSTFGSANDSARITLRGQTVANEGSARSVATSLDSRNVSFAPERAGANHFTWSRDSDSTWTATLRSGGATPRTTIYKLERVAP